MDTETYSTLKTISDKFNISKDRLDLIKNSESIKRITRADRNVLYNEKDITRNLIVKRDYLYIRFDTEEQVNELKDKRIKEIKESFPDHSIIVGVSKDSEINSSLLFLFHLCSRNDVRSLVFYDANTISLELIKLVELLVSYTGTTIAWYKID